MIEEVVGFVLFLVLDLGVGVIGVIMFVDGGIVF